MVDWVDKLIHGELCMEFKFYYTKKWYMHNPASLMESDT